MTGNLLRHSHEGRVALVTGGARGIGYEIARVLAFDGADVVLFDLLGGVSDAADAITGECGRRALGVQGSVTDEKAVMRAIAEAGESLGQVDILVNNAALTTNVDRVVNMPVDRFRHDIEVNLVGAFSCIKHVLPGMLARQWGRIINISSGAAELGSFGQSGYSASKSGMLGLTRSVALECARKQVTCNAVMPGLIDAPAADGIRGDMRERISALIPSRRLGTPQEVAYTVSFLASARASYINGESIFVSSGQELFVF